MTQSRLSTEDMVRPMPDDGAEPATPSTSVETTSEDVTLLDDIQATDFLDRWSDVQSRFVDDPQGAVRDGDSLVAELMQALAERFSQHKSGLEEQWQRGTEPETEQLRLALQSYRSFFQRLLST
jgi:hypothetical protein